MINFDNNSSTPVAPEVAEAMKLFVEGELEDARSAKSVKMADLAERKARVKVAALIGASSPDEIFFRATDSPSYRRPKPVDGPDISETYHLITAATEDPFEHGLLRGPGRQNCEMTRVALDADGTIDLSELREALRPTTRFVSFAMANNETGEIQPIAAIAAIVRDRSNAILHVGGSDAVGRIPIDLKNTQIDMFSFSSHRLHGPPGIEALYVRKGLEVGMDEPGSAAIHSVVGLGAAADLAAVAARDGGVRELRDRLESGILDNIENSRVNGSVGPQRRLPSISSVSFLNVNGEMVKARLAEAHISVSTSSACHSGAERRNGVLQAMDVPYEYAMGAIRFSLSRYNTGQEVATVLEVLPGIVGDLRKIAGTV